VLLLIRLIASVLLCSLTLQISACAVRPTLNDDDWLQLSPEERRLFFENILEERHKPVEHLRVAYLGIGGFVAFFGLGVVFGKNSGNGLLSWLVFASTVGIFWGGIGAAIQKNATGQRKRIAARELAILDHPEWRREKIRAIRDGQIDIGYNELMLISAWGEPQVKLQNVNFNGVLYEEWSYLIKRNTKVYIDAGRKVAIIQTPEMTYMKNSSNR